MNRLEPTLGIHRRYLHDEVAQRLRELIRVGELEPRARINELELTARFGISRTPAEGGHQDPRHRGSSRASAQSGCAMASVSVDEVDEMIEVIAGLEATAADLACRSITDQEVAAIEAKHHAMVAAGTKRQSDLLHLESADP